MHAWEDYWDEAQAFKRITNCDDLILAYLIKDSAPVGSELATSLRDLSHTGGDGYLDIKEVGLEGVKARMEADFCPKKQHMASQARVTYENTRRRFKERPKWFFRRLEMNEMLMIKADPNHQISTSYKANLVFHNLSLIHISEPTRPY